jgi:hypothetical protein
VKRKGTIDVWWLYDDGGLTLLLPYILTTRFIKLTIILPNSPNGSSFEFSKPAATQKPALLRK